MQHDDASTIRRWRDETPGTEHRNHLNNAGAALMPLPVLQAMRGHLDLEATIGGYEAAEAASAGVAAAYDAIADLTRTKPRNVALADSATTAFARAMSTVPWAPGDVLVTTVNDYASNHLTFLALAERRGIEIRRARDLPEGGVDPDSVRQLAGDSRCRLVAVTWVPTNTGLIQPVAEVGRVCESLGVRYLIDACQAAGQLPLDVPALRCDYLSATGRKFLRGPRGTGFLVVADRALERGDRPAFPDLRSATWTGPETFRLRPDAARFEYWESSVLGVMGLGAAAAYAARQGVDRTGARAGALAARLRQGLADLDGVRLLDAGSDLSAIVALEVLGWAGQDVVLALRERGINTSSFQREGALLALDVLGVTSGLRISPHYYNSEAEIDDVIEALAVILR